MAIVKAKTARSSVKATTARRAVETTPARSLGTRPAQAKKSGAGDRLRRIQRAAALLKQVSDPTRLRILTLLADGDQHVGGLATELGYSQPAVSHHLALLRHGGLIAPRREGKNNYYHLTDAGLKLTTIVKKMVG